MLLLDSTSHLIPKYFTSLNSFYNFQTLTQNETQSLNLFSTLNYDDSSVAQPYKVQRALISKSFVSFSKSQQYNFGHKIQIVKSVETGLNNLVLIE